MIPDWADWRFWICGRNFEYFIPGGKGQLKLPINCCVDERGYLIVADANRGQIVVFDQERNYLHAFGEAEGFKPTDVEVYQDRIWVANVQDHAIICLWCREL